MNDKNTNRLFQRDFTLVVIGQVISLFGNAILRFALPLYLLRETGSSALFGAVTAISFLPMVVLSMIGGVLADRVNKRNIMVILDSCTAVIILAFYFLLGEVPVVALIIVTLMLLYGISGTYQPTVQASIPVLVPQEKLMVGNAVISQVNTLSGLLGPVIGGMLFGVWGINPILLISIACFAFSAVMESFIHIPFQKQARTKGVLSVAKDDLKDSYLFVKREKPIFFSVLYIVSAFNLVLSAVMIVGIPVLVIQTLGMSDAMLGFTQGALGFGGLIGGFLTALIAKRLRVSNVYWLLIICAVSVACIGVSLFFGLPEMISYCVITLMSFISMGAATLFNIQMFTMVQQQTPPQLIGKIMAAIISIALCAQPIGQAIYGLLFEVLKDSTWIVMIAASIAALLISLYSKKVFGKLESQ